MGGRPPGTLRTSNEPPSTVAGGWRVGVPAAPGACGLVGCGYDANGNREFARITQAEAENTRSFLYDYDRLNRLILAEHGPLDAENDGFDAQGALPKARTWQLDLLGNWGGGDALDGSVQTFVDANRDQEYTQGETFLRREHHDTNAVNEINSVTVNAANAALTHDAAGNLIDDVTHEYTYDAWNRIVEVVDSTTQDEIATYAYDALGRRINKKVSNSGALNTDDAGDFFYYDGNRLLEHHHDADPSGDDYQREYVWGLEYIDEAVAQYDTEPGQTAELYYILIDANYNVVAVVDAGNGSTPPGTLIQQYNYWPYGTLLAAESCDAGPPEAVTAIDFETYPEQLATNIGHQGLLWDFESWLTFNRARTYAPDLGRFMQRDPNDTASLFLTAIVYNASMPGSLLDVSLSVPYGDGMSLYQFVGSNPLIATDPSGRFSFIDISGSAALQGELASLYNDPVLSLVDAMKGIAMLQLQRHAALDNMLEYVAFDFSGIEKAEKAYQVFQMGMLALSAKDLALGLGRVAIGSVKFGARVFGSLAKKGGGRRALLGVLERGGNAIRRFFGFGSASRGRLPWLSWSRYPKVMRNGREYAKIGDRLYTHHAVDNMTPMGLGAPAGAKNVGRGVSPNFVEDVIMSGDKTLVVEKGVERTIHTSGDVKVVTEEADSIVVTVIRFRGG